MDEVDKIIIQSLTSIGCEITTDIRSMSQFDQEMFIESVAKLLNTLNPSAELPTKLPPNTGVKFRICTKFANICQTLGYKNEIGYQTFLYLNEQDMRRLLMFLVEKLNKEMSALSASDQSSQASSESKVKSLNYLITQRIKSSLSQFWMPPYCKLNSLRIQEDDKFTIEGCKCLSGYNTVDLAIPYNNTNPKSKQSNEMNQYLEKHCLYVTSQAKRQAVDLLTSLMQMNTNERLKEQTMLRQDMNPVEEAKKTETKVANLNGLKDALRDGIKKASQLVADANSSSGSGLTHDDIAEIDRALDLSPKSMSTKASRFAHSEKLQFTKESDQGVSVVTTSTEEKKEEELKKLKADLEQLNQTFEDLEQELKKLNNSILSVEQNCKDQVELNKKVEEDIAVKEKTVKLIKNAPQNIQTLKNEINGHEDKMADLEQQWNRHKKPLELEREELQQKLSQKRVEMQDKLEQTKQIRKEIDALNAELTSKEELIVELNQDVEKNAKASSKNTNRQFYTKRILEIMANIDKQKKEINKVLIETRNIQKEINQLIGKLERIFTSTDELIYKDAKKDETTKKVYKLFIGINDSYEQLIRTIEESSHIERDNRDLEDQVNSESQNKVADNMEMVLKDYKQIREENDALKKSLKAAKA